MSGENRKKKVVNMNYPPKDMPIEEQERFWGTYTEEEKAEMARVREWARRNYPNVKPRPV